MENHATRDALLIGVLAVWAAAGCSSSEPSQSPLVLAKAPIKSGDSQTGPAGEALPNELRVIVTRDGAPQIGVSVTWSTPSEGSVNPETDQTDDTGISATTWTLGPVLGAQSAQAAVTDATDSPQTFTGTATSGGGGGPPGDPGALVER